MKQSLKVPYYVFKPLSPNSGQHQKETTMARHGTLPEFMYQRQCEIFENPVSIAFDVQSDDTSDDTAVNQLEEEEGDNFDESSDEEVEEDSTLLQGEIGS